MRVTSVSDLVTAIDQARFAATHGDVVIMGAGDVIGQALEQGLVDELRLRIVEVRQPQRWNKPIGRPVPRRWAVSLIVTIERSPLVAAATRWMLV
jgi:hypothetical protein